MESEHHIYSLRGILDSDRLDPNLCRLMLNEIKSPLLDHSFQMTADDDVTDKNFGQFSRQQKTPNNGSFDRPNLHDHNHLDSYSMTNSYYETSRKADIFKERPSNSVIPNQLKQKFAQSIVSPLDHHKFLTNDQENEDIFHIIFDTANKHKPKQQPAAKWCGGIFNPNLEQYTKQIMVDPKDYQYVRRKIFKKNNQQKMNKNSLPNNFISFRESIARLQTIQEHQLANFINFLSKCLPILRKIVPYCKNLNKNSPVLNQILLQHNPVHYQTRESIQNKDRICNRLQTYQTSDLLKKISNNIYYHDASHKKQLRQYVQSDIEFILKSLNEVEDIIQNYVSRQNTIQQLKTVHILLYQTNRQEHPDSPIQSLKINSMQPIRQKYENDHSLKIKLIRILSSLKIDEYQYENLEELRYIWPDIQENGGYSSQNKFIKQICRNDLLLPAQNYKQNMKQKQTEVIRKLQMQGFTKNV